MKTYKKALGLVKKGLSPKLVSSLSESQVNLLYNKLVINEQSDKSVINVVSNDENKLNQVLNAVSKLPTSDKPVIQVENDDEEEFGDKVLKQYSKGEVDEEESNPWAICTAQLGDEFGTTKRSQWSPKQKNKFERCVKDVKESLTEGKNPVSLFLENQITKIVEKNIPPRISKGDLIKYLNESKSSPSREKSPVIAPSKPKTSPNPVRHPGKKPFEGPNPEPKAKSKKIDPEMAKDSVINTIMNIIKK